MERPNGGNVQSRNLDMAALKGWCVEWGAMSNDSVRYKQG